MANQQKSLAELTATAEKWLLKDPDLASSPTEGVEMQAMMKAVEASGNPKAILSKIISEEEMRVSANPDDFYVGEGSSGIELTDMNETVPVSDNLLANDEYEDIKLYYKGKKSLANLTKNEQDVALSLNVKDADFDKMYYSKSAKMHELKTQLQTELVDDNVMSRSGFQVLEEQGFQKFSNLFFEKKILEKNGDTSEPIRGIS